MGTEDLLQLLWLVPAAPLAAFAMIVLCGRRLPRALVATVGVGASCLSAIVAALVTFALVRREPSGAPFVQTLWPWIGVGDFQASVSFALDPLSAVMVLVVSVVGFLILLYSVGYMAGDEGYGRFFAYMNLFVGSMLTLVLAQDMLLLYMGWEGVGLCSYLLIGFWYRDPVNVRAARKAFLVTRVGDAALLVGIILLFTHLRTLEIATLMQRAAQEWPAGSALALAAATLVLAGAVGKSAQLPLQTWLPDAMAGPTPVSALIHAATMVTAGVYLIARTGELFALAPAVQNTVALIGAATLLLGACSALVQTDIKRVLAYSTMSQVGYMFLALGVGATSAAIFHFMTHAVFKSLLFLSAGAVILALHHQQDIFRMGALRKEMPLAFWTFLIAAASLSALPLVTAGFYSKEMILSAAWASGDSGRWLWAAALAGAILTSLYIFRVVFLVFGGPIGPKPSGRTGPAMGVPLVVLAVLAIVAGFVELPPWLGNVTILTDFLGTLGPPVKGATGSAAQAYLGVAASAASVTGIVLAYLFFSRGRGLTGRFARAHGVSGLRLWWLAGWGFDDLYELLVVRPFLWAARVNRDDAIDLLYEAVATAAKTANRALALTQNGLVRWSAAAVALGGLVALLVVVLS